MLLIVIFHAYYLTCNYLILIVPNNRTISYIQKIFSQGQNAKLIYVFVTVPHINVVAIFTKPLIVMAMDLVKPVLLILVAWDVTIIHNVSPAFHRNNLLIRTKIVSIAQNIVQLVLKINSQLHQNQILIHNTSESNCQSCITNNYYLDAGLCKQCEFPCQSCNSQYNCITCVSQQFYPISGLCRQCDSPCLTCLNQTQCLTCVDNSYYLDQITCVPCKSPCLTCSNQNLCFTYYNQNANKFDYNGQCIVQCPLNCLICQKNQQCSTCQDGYYLNDSYSCVKCQDPCENCLSQELCITCQSLYYQKNQHCILCQQPCITCVDEQICSSCVDGYYLFNQTCNQCSINCLKCNQFGCYQCNKQSQLFNAQCIDCTIPMNHTLDICNYRDCHDGVWTHGEECDNGNSYGCINCTIQKGYYCINLNGYPSQCSRCIENCIQCEVDRFCLVCKDGYFLNPNHQCQECNVECRTCFYQPNNCSSCKINNLGFQSCHLCEINRGYYTDFENNQCYSKCGDNIKTIQEQCDDGNNFNGDGCSSKCQIEDGFYCIVFYQNHYQIFSINQLMILDLERIIQKIMCV